MRQAILAALACLASAPAIAQQPPLTQGPGRELVEAACATCHSLAYIRMNSRFLTPDIWKAEVNKMRVMFGAPIDDDAAAAIVKYLASQYGGQAKP